jgi:signal transduction histidine kinase/ActR/RegA family two-component response regulator/Flp pilus assembly protein TadD
MMADPAAALAKARGLVKLADSIESPAARAVGLATAAWLESEALVRLNRIAEAAPRIAAAFAAVEMATPGTKLHGDILMTRAGIQAKTGHAAEALHDLLEAHAIFQAVGAKRSQSIALQNIGSIYTDAGDYARALDYYVQSAEAFGDDPALKLSSHNNRGNALKELGRLDEAEQEYGAARQLAQQMASPLLEVRIMTNLASTQILQERYEAADETARSALEIAAAHNIAGWSPFLWGIRAQVALALSDLPSAARFIAKTFDGLTLSETTMPYRDFHLAASEIYRRSSAYKTAYVHLQAYQRLDQEAHEAINSNRSALLAAEFDSANQKYAIADLKAGQMARDKALAATEARFQMTVVLGLLAATLIVALLSLAGTVSLRKSRNQTRVVNTQLEIANDALERAVMARNEFLAMTSHEIRTPLNGILGMTDVLLMKRSLDDDVRESVRLVRSAGHTMKALVDDILDVAKMEAGQMTLERRRFDLRATLEDAGALARSQGEVKGIDVILDLETCPRNWTGDQQRLRQLVFNLLSNAVKFTEQGWVRLSVSNAPAPDEQNLVIRVADTGIGIAPENQGKIFEAFRQADASTTRKHGGTGLGLAICDRIVKALGGTFALESEIGRGSVFTVTLKGVDTGTESALSDREPDGALLLIDENPLRQGILSAALEADGHDVATADAWDEGLVLAGRQAFAMVIVAADALGTGSVEGLGLVRSLRSSQPDSWIVVVADGLDDAGVDYLAHGASECIPPAAASAPLRARAKKVMQQMASPLAA